MKRIQHLRGATTIVVLFFAGLSIAVWPGQVFAEEDELPSAYDQFWGQVAPLLEVREYASALELISGAKKEPDLKDFQDRLVVDHKDVQLLQRLASVVKEQVSKLKPGDPLKVGSSEYKVVKFVSDAKGERIVLESSNGGAKTEKTLAQLDPKSWIAIAQSALTTSAEDRYVMGMFQASVEHGDRKAARQILNLAAAEKISVTHWTARIDAEAKALEDERNAKKAERDDPILGTWRLVIGNGKDERRLNITFRERGKTDQRTSTWRKAKDNDYVLSFPNGATARLSLGPKGEGLKGHMANGTPVHGSRQAKAKR